MDRKVVRTVVFTTIFLAAFTLFANCSLFQFPTQEEIDNIIAGFDTIGDDHESTPPDEVANLTAESGINQISLSWANPADDDFAGVKIVYKTGGYPADDSDGEVLLDSADETVLHTSLDTETTYYYSVFTYDTDGNMSQGTNLETSPLGPEISAWENTNPFPDIRGGHLGLECNGYLYVLGGIKNGDRYDTVYYAPINPDKTVGTWNTTTQIYRVLNSFAGFSYNNRLYMFQGEDGSAAYNDVKYAAVNSDGTLGAWNTATVLPNSVRGSTAVEHNGYAYVTGGKWSSTTYGDVHYGKIEADGNIANWNGTTSLPGGSEVEGHVCITTEDYIYVLGGDRANNDYTDEVYFSSFNQDNTIGPWQLTTSIPVNMGWFTGFEFNGYIYISGGRNSSGKYNNVYYSEINSDGTLSQWEELENFTGERNGFGAVVFDSTFYIFGGGNDSTQLKDVQYARLVP